MSSDPTQFPQDNFIVRSLDYMESFITRAQEKLAGIIRVCCSAIISN